MDNFNLFISDAVLLEIEKIENIQLHNQMTQFISPFKSLIITPDIEESSLEYIKNSAIPQNHLEDAYPIAIATINEMDCLIS